MRRKHKLSKIFLLSLLVAFILGGNVMAAAFNFSFITGSTSIGGVGFKNAESRLGVDIHTYYANVNSSRYITVWGATNTGRAITQTGTIREAWSPTFINFTDRAYEGNYYLYGNPSVIGASAKGEFYG